MSDSTFKVEIQGLDKLVAAFNKAPDIAEPTLQRAIVTSTDVLAKYTVRPNVPYRTGYLIQTFRRDVSRLMSRWFPTATYASAVEFGTKPHVILPVNKEALYWKGAAHPVKKVNHPGTKGQRFMEAIRDHATSEINEVFGQAVRKVTDDIAIGAK